MFKAFLVLSFLTIPLFGSIVSSNEAKAEKAALESKVFQAAQEKLKSQLHNPTFVSRSVVAFGGQKTFNPTETFLIIERWYGFDTYENLIAEVTLSALPPHSEPKVSMKRLIED